VKHQTKRENSHISEQAGTRGTGDSTGSNTCPKCGGEMVSVSQGVTTEYPSPALERLVCSVSGCNYVRYSKLDETGFADSRKAVGGKGA
jgi:hypothetical protein